MCVSAVWVLCVCERERARDACVRLSAFMRVYEYIFKRVTSAHFHVSQTFIFSVSVYNISALNVFHVACMCFLLAVSSLRTCCFTDGDWNQTQMREKVHMIWSQIPQVSEAQQSWRAQRCQNHDQNTEPHDKFSNNKQSENPTSVDFINLLLLVCKVIVNTGNSGHCCARW